MKSLEKLQLVTCVLSVAAVLSCGGTNPPGGFGDDGGSGSSGDNGTFGSDASGSGSSGGGGGQGFNGTDAGGGEGGSVTSCVNGATRTCCNSGKQTCSAAGELPMPVWGPCLAPSGAPMTCVPTPCLPGQTEIAGGCVDAGPPPGPPPAPPPVCTDDSVSTEPEILVGYSPAMGQSVGTTGQIKVWVTDENSPFIAPGEQVNNMTGAITTPGTRTATAADGLLDEPALYIAPQTPTNGGTPHFPQWIKGSYNNNPPARGTFTGGATIDPPPAGGRGGGFFANYQGEFIWDVRALGLAPGSYTAVFSVHDGDRDRAIGCVTIVITAS